MSDDQQWNVALDPRFFGARILVEDRNDAPQPSFDGAAGHTTRRRWLASAASAACAWPGLAGAQQVRTWPRGAATPALQLSRQDGGVWRLASARGRPVLLNFWASWCEPCREEMPSLERLAAQYEPQGLLVMAINFRETDAAVRRFLEPMAFSPTVLRDRDGAAAKAFGVRIFPSTVLIDRRGQTQSVVVGECDWSSSSARRWVGTVL
jgi:thiol-disulfide isomerase/thioredoxin